MSPAFERCRLSILDNCRLYLENKKDYSLDYKPKFNKKDRNPKIFVFKMGREYLLVDEKTEQLRYPSLPMMHLQLDTPSTGLKLS